MFTLPKLPYEYSDLEPYINGLTMEIHHTKHHATYVEKLNQALEKFPELLKKDVNELIADIAKVPDDVQVAVINHGGGHANHSFFWNIMSPKSIKLEGGKLFEGIKETFGDIETFQEKFTGTALGRFGSGWAWLVKTNSGLEITSTANQDSPLSLKQIPVIGIDVWEHAYYLKYQNKRADYIKAWWNIVNWEEAEKIFTAF